MFGFLVNFILALCQNYFFSFLAGLKEGHLVVKTAAGKEFVFGNSHLTPVTITLRNEINFYWRVLTRWDLGIAEAFMSQDIDISDLTLFFGIMVKNRDVSDGGSWIQKIGRFLSILDHIVLHRNTVDKAKQNIAEHYDLSNDMFQTFLDPTMTYSCAVFESPEDTLEQAQYNKIHKLIREANITKDDHVLEIGSGWGAFSIEAVKTTGCKVTTITISEEQFSEAKLRIEKAGLQDKINIQLIDYRKVQGKFNKVISVEMIEAVGHEFLPGYFATIDRLLAPNGVAMIQAITYPDHRYNQYRKGVDFIQKYIFPGGLCPSITSMCQAMQQSTQLQIERLDNIGLHYATTLKMWRQNFIKNKARVMELGFDERFFRKWLYYFTYCEAGFETKVLGTLHLLITRPGNETLKQSPLSKEDYNRTRRAQAVPI